MAPSLFPDEVVYALEQLLGQLRVLSPPVKMGMGLQGVLLRVSGASHLASFCKCMHP